jgi:hypothetical protein
MFEGEERVVYQLQDLSRLSLTPPRAGSFWELWHPSCVLYFAYEDDDYHTEDGEE